MEFNEIPKEYEKYFKPIELGQEKTFTEFVNKLCDIFDEVKRVLKNEGGCYVNLGDTYMGNSSYSNKGRQGFGDDKSSMINKTDDILKDVFIGRKL